MKKMWLRMSMLLLAGFLILGSSSVEISAKSSSVANIPIVMNGKTFKNKGVMGSEGTLIPLQLLVGDLGMAMKYDAKSKTFQFTAGKDALLLHMSEGGTSPVFNGHDLGAFYPREMIGGHNYVSISVLTDILGYRSDWNPVTKTVALSKIQQNDIMWSVKKLEKETKDASISIQYPQVSGLKDDAVQTKINQIFEENAKQFYDEDLESAEGVQEELGFKYEFTSNYDIKYNSNDVISVLFRDSLYMGGAHDMPSQYSYTINLKTGKVYTLDDLLQSNPNYVQVINGKIKKDIEPMLITSGSFQSVGDNPSFYVHNDGVVIYFSVYEYTPYVEGFPEFYFTFKTLLPEAGGKLPF